MGAHTATIRVLVNDATIEEPSLAELSRAFGDWLRYAHVGAAIDL